MFSFYFLFFFFFFFSSRRRHTRSLCDWSSDVCSSDLTLVIAHRPATIALADRVAVVEDGRVVEQRSEERRVGKSVDLGGRRIIQKKKENKQRDKEDRRMAKTWRTIHE